MSYNNSMNLLKLLNKKGYSGYSLSKESGIPYTTIKDLLNGKRKIENLPGKTILALSITLDCTMEEIMNMDIDNNFINPDSYLTKSEYYTDLLKNKKNVILAKDSALEFHHLSNDNINKSAYVYSCGELNEPFVYKKVDNFDGIDYEVIDGVMVTSVNQTVNDIINDNDIDLQPLYEALSKIYYKNNESFDSISIEEKNKEKFEEIAKNCIDYYNEY